MFVALFNLDLLLHSHDLFILDKHISQSCVDNQHHLVHRISKCTSHVNAFTVTRQY